MASLGNQADLDWSPWEWVEQRRSWRSVGTDRNGVVIRTEWYESGYRPDQLDSSQEPQESTPPYYSHAGGSAGYQVPAENSPPRNQNAVNIPIASSGYLTAATARPFGSVSFSTSSYQYPSEWNSTHLTTGQLNQTSYPSSSYPSAGYNEQRQSLSYSNSQTVPGPPSDLQIGSNYAGGQNIAAPYDRAQAVNSHQPTEFSERPIWPSEIPSTSRRDLRVPSGFVQRKNPPVDNTVTSESHGEFAASGQQSATSGFRSRTESNEWSTESQYDSQSRYARDSSTTPKPRQSGFEGSPSPEGDEIDKRISRILKTASKSSTMDTAGRFYVVESQEHNAIQDRDSKENVSSSTFQNTDYTDSSGDEGARHTISSSHTSRSRRRSSTVYPRGTHRDSAPPKSRNSQKYRDDLEGATLQIEKTSLGSRTAPVYERTAMSTSPLQEPISRDRLPNPQRSEKTPSYGKNPVVEVQQHQTKHRKTHRRGSEVQQPRERLKDSSKSGGSRHGQQKLDRKIPVSGEQRSRDQTILSRHSQQQSVDRMETPLDKNFKVHGSEFFREGAVFKTTWSEPLGETNRGLSDIPPTEDNDAIVVDSILQQRAYHSVRRFAVVVQREGHCLCLPILTYGRQGTTKPGVKAEYHAIIYTGAVPPKPLKGEDGLGNRPIRVDNTHYGEEPLWEESRINYSKVYTIEHNIKVCFVGEIHPNSIARFKTDFKALLNR